MSHHHQRNNDGGGDGGCGGGGGGHRHRPASLSLHDMGLPAAVVERFVAGGVKNGAMYPWQRAAIDTAADGASLVFCAPTSGGKSLVAEVLLVRRLARRAAEGRPGRVLVVMPYHSLVNEKVVDLQQRLAPMFNNNHHKRGGGRPEMPVVAVRGFAGPESEGRPLRLPLGHPGQEVVAVTTIEKASIAVSRLASEGRLGELCAVVVDELHMVGEEGRGAVLEAMLSKIRFAARKGVFHAGNGGGGGGGGSGGDGSDGIQIIAMSATVSHDSLERLAGWLNAQLFITNFRPVPLSEHVVVGGHVLVKRMEEKKQLPGGGGVGAGGGGGGQTGGNDGGKKNRAPPNGGGRAGAVLGSAAGGGGNGNGGGGGVIGGGLISSNAIIPDVRSHPRFDVLRPVPEMLSPSDLDKAKVLPGDRTTAQLVLEVAADGHSCLVFCPSRKKTQELAGALARAVQLCPALSSGGNGGHGGGRGGGGAAGGAARRRVEQMLETAADGYPDPNLVAAVRCGVGYHHAQMPKKEKEIVEEAFRRGALHTLTCTTTLAAGVNLPARRVLILDNPFGYSTSQYRQMSGRAGRAGQSKIGEAFVLPAPDSGGRRHPIRGAGAGGGGDAVDAAFATVASRLPGLTSQLLEPRVAAPAAPAAAAPAAPVAPPAPAPAAGTAAAAAPAAAADDDAATKKDVTEMATLVLQCVASGTLRTARDQAELLLSTFAWSVRDHRPRLRAAMDGAMKHLYKDLVGGNHLFNPLFKAKFQSTFQSHLSIQISKPYSQQTYISKPSFKKSFCFAFNAPPYILGLIETRYDDAEQGGGEGPGAAAGKSLSAAAAGAAAVWGPTAAGAAAHRSSLPLRHAVELLNDLRATVRRGLYLNSPSTGASLGRLHLLFLCIHRGGGGGNGRNSFAALAWDPWERFLSMSKNSGLSELGDLLGAEVGYARKMMRGGGVDSRSSAAARKERHGRLAAAATLNAMLEGDVLGAKDVGAAAERPPWLGQLQQLQADTAANAAMAGNMAAAAGWHNMAELLNGLARELDVGATRELSTLMAVAAGAGGGGGARAGGSGSNLRGGKGWVMTVSRARALFKAGLKTPSKVVQVGGVSGFHFYIRM
jgi:hypothetical protein